MRRPLRRDWKLAMVETMPRLSPDDVRTLFSRALSEMYRREVPQYQTLLELVATVNATTREENPELDERIEEAGETGRLAVERHGAIRLGTAEELATMRRLFAIMGMAAVGYYDLSIAGVPVHSTAFRPVDEVSLRRNPLRIFTSLLRLDLIADVSLRESAAAILSQRRIFSERCLALIATAERNRGLTQEEAEAFVEEAVSTFRWHGDSTVPEEVYERLRAAHPLLADVVCFRGPHINHMTPRTLDIDMVQSMMPQYGIAAKAVIEGPPPRKVAILLRQTSFKAIEEPVSFSSAGRSIQRGHTARFGEIEQRGAALTQKGRALYDRLLAVARSKVDVAANGSNAEDYVDALAAAFASFPDSERELREEELAFFRYVRTAKKGAPRNTDLNKLIEHGFVRAEPITYEDFLPVSAAGIFQSNLGDNDKGRLDQNHDQAGFEAALGARVIDEIGLYEEEQARSMREIHQAFRKRAFA